MPDESSQQLTSEATGGNLPQGNKSIAQPEEAAITPRQNQKKRGGLQDGKMKKRVTGKGLTLTPPTLKTPLVYRAVREPLYKNVTQSEEKSTDLPQVRWG